MQEKGKTAYLDPTCGEGEILMQLKKEIIGASKSAIKLFGCEIDLERSNKAKTLLDRVLYSSIENCVIENNYFSLVFLILHMIILLKVLRIENQKEKS